MRQRRRRKVEMSARKSEMVSVMGTVWEIVKAVWNAVLDFGGTDDDMRNVLRNKDLANSLALVILGRAEVVLKNKAVSDLNILDSWAGFYREYFGLTVGFSGLKIPPKSTEGNWRLLVIASNLTNNQVYDACKKQFSCYKYTYNLDKDISRNERDPKKGNYAIWVRDTVEADEVHKNKSANMITKEGLKTETLLERMLHELVYFSETGSHLDVNNVTLCSGSCSLGGSVPGADWYGGRFRVNWDGTAGRDGCLRSREVVS